MKYRPAIGPSVGDCVTQHGGWKWSQYTLTIFTFVTYFPIFFLEEMYLKIIMTQTKQKREIAAAQAENKLPASALLLSVLFITILRSIKMLVSKLIATFLSLCCIQFRCRFLFLRVDPVCVRKYLWIQWGRDRAGLHSYWVRMHHIDSDRDIL